MCTWAPLTGQQYDLELVLHWSRMNELDSDVYILCKRDQHWRTTYVRTERERERERERVCESVSLSVSVCEKERERESSIVPFDVLHLTAIKITQLPFKQRAKRTSIEYGVSGTVGAPVPVHWRQPPCQERESLVQLKKMTDGQDTAMIMMCNPNSIIIAVRAWVQ